LPLGVQSGPSSERVNSKCGRSSLSATADISIHPKEREQTAPKERKILPIKMSSHFTIMDAACLCGCLLLGHCSLTRNFRMMQPMVSADRLAIVPLLPEAIVAKLFPKAPPPISAAKPAPAVAPKAAPPAAGSPPLPPVGVSVGSTVETLAPQGAAASIIAPVAAAAAKPAQRVESAIGIEKPQSTARAAPNSSVPASAVTVAAGVTAGPQPPRQSIRGRPRGKKFLKSPGLQSRDNETS
jgi:hypothetical protein